MKIIADNNIPYLEGRLEKAGAEVEYVDQAGFTPEVVRDADGLLIRTRTRINRELLEGSAVKMVATATIGTDQIDFSYTGPAGIEVRNSPGCNAPGVAQYVWSALLRLGFDPKRHTLGVVGKGNVGSIVVEWGRRLGAKVIVCDPPRAERGEEDEKYLSLNDLLAEADAVSFHTPLIKEGDHPTVHLLDAAGLASMKPDAILINAARGPVVDNHALKEHLRKQGKHSAKAGSLSEGGFRTAVDTWEGEPALDRELLGMVDYGTFHIAGYSRQGKERATRMVLEAVEEILGVPADKSGLEGPYMPPADLSAESITASYDPAIDTEALRKEPENFDLLRHHYAYREEVR